MTTHKTTCLFCLSGILPFRPESAALKERVCQICWTGIRKEAEREGLLELLQLKQPA